MLGEGKHWQSVLTVSGKFLMVDRLHVLCGGPQTAIIVPAGLEESSGKLTDSNIDKASGVYPTLLSKGLIRL